MNKNFERLYNGIIKENPTFVLMLGMCPTLAVTTSVVNAIGMGLSTTAVLMFSNLIISGQSKNSGIYSNSCFTGYSGTAFDGGLYTCTL